MVTREHIHTGMDFTDGLKRRILEERGGLRFVPGLTVIEDFILPGEETRLIEWVNKQRWRDDLGRRVQHYGFRYDYKTRKVVNDVDDIPTELDFLLDRLVVTGLMAQRPTQIIVNEYKSKQGISPHTDHQKWFDGEIATLSMGTTEAMDFKHGNNRVCTTLHKRSVAVMKGEARYSWTHAITPQTRANPRISITFRRCAPAALREMGVLAAHNQRTMDEQERATVSPPPIIEEDAPAPVEEPKGDAADPIEVEEPKGDAADPVVVEASPPGKRKAEDEGDAPDPKVLCEVASPESPAPEDKGPPEDPMDTEKPALGTLVELCVGVENPGDEESGSTAVNVWFPNDIHPEDLKEGKAFQKDGPSPDGESQYHEVINGDGYDRIQHLLNNDISDEWEMTGDYEPNLIYTGVPITDERIRLRIVRLGLKETKWEWHPKTEKNSHGIDT